MTASNSRPADFDTFGGDQVVWEDLAGSLLFVRPVSIETGVRTVHGVSDAVYVDLAVLDGEYEGDKYQDVLVFPKVLVSVLKRKMTDQERKDNVGGLILGRLVQRPARIDPDTGKTAINPETGQEYNPSWRFDQPTEQDIAVGRKFLAAQKSAAHPTTV